MKVFKNNVNNNSAHIDGPGKHASRASDEDSVKIFIESYHPVVSHYYWEKAPQRRKLPRQSPNMHNAYSTCHSTISYSTFYLVIKAMKIYRWPHWENEECEKCERYKQHQNSCTCIDLYDINEFDVHKAKYKPARAVYTKALRRTASNSVTSRHLSICRNSSCCLG